MTSLWLSDRVETATPPGVVESAGRSADVVVVGAGITGLTVAVLLARAGKRVVVLEARYVGAGTTGNTTGKVTLLQGTKLSRIASKHGSDVLRAYVTGNTEGRDWLLRHCDDHGIPVQREDDYSYAQTLDGVGDARAVLAACREAGVEAEWVPDAGVPFPYHGGVRLRDQAQIDPMPLLNSLAVELEAHGGTLLQGVRAHSVSGRSPLRISVYVPTSAQAVEPERFSLTTEQIVLATGIPILDRGGFFARLKPHRSYCMAFDVPGDVTRPMFISVDSPTRSVRYAPTPDGDKLVVGGAGHTVGRADAPSDAVRELARWAALHYPGAVQTHFWSAQDYTPVDELPDVGPLLPGTDKIYVATGFDKWGMTNGVAAALALSSRILGGRMDWSSAFAPWSRHELSGIPAALQANLEVGLNLAKGWIAPATAGSTEPSEGEGVVTGPPWHLRAKCVVDGVPHTVSPVCPHLGGIVTWNDADHAWECPLHGSRFAPDGELLEGPATRGLSPSRQSATSVR
ncbi:MAG TPA: FAD-dependent oxidoreductase [Mycobacterium sp.]|jgi:glycine/D-amino acid oxidase-like deaminating enzyme/nitrite reductase/ring-hydroxylating ferredoxin subunit|nr:FAD-dependent oxidoreductase [Mycobacterium sp.]